MFNLLILLLIFGGVIWLQIYFSKQENKWLGLILPVGSFLISIIIALSLGAFWTMTDVEIIEMTETASEKTNEIVGSENILANQAEESNTTQMLVTTISIFLLTNIPTAILLLIYFGERKKFNKRIELEKMNVLDLD